MRELCQQLGHSIGLSQVIPGTGLAYGRGYRRHVSVFHHDIAGNPGRSFTRQPSARSPSPSAPARSARLDNLTHDKITPHTITSRDKLKREIDSIDKRGWAVSTQRAEHRHQCARGSRSSMAGGSLLGALAALDLIHLLPEKPSRQQISAVTDAAKKISQRLGYR